MVLLFNRFYVVFAIQLQPTKYTLNFLLNHFVMLIDVRRCLSIFNYKLPITLPSGLKVHHGTTY